MFRKYLAIARRVAAITEAAERPQPATDADGNIVLEPPTGAARVLEDIELGLEQVEGAYRSAVDHYDGFKTVYERVQGYLD